jgi:2-polyprenyl-3-methyl-5-hydroxy-6-metoxy-1,4-benzoquinol methylase
VSAKTELNVITDYLSDPSLRKFIFDNFRESLRGIGHSEAFIEDLIATLETLENISVFRKQHLPEIENVYLANYFQDLLSLYFEENFIPFLPPAKKVLDLGCGTGLLSHKLAKNYPQVVGIDIEANPLWNQYQNSQLSFEIVPENRLSGFLKSYQPTRRATQM